MRRYLRAANITWDGLHLEDIKEMNFTRGEREIFRLRSGDLLLSEASGSADEVGKPALWADELPECYFQNTLLRVRAPGLHPKYLLWLFKWLAASHAFGRASRGVGIHHLGAQALSKWQIPIAPLAEQRRIVDAIEQQFSRLDAGMAALESAQRKLRRLRAAVLRDHLTHTDVPETSIKECATAIQYGYTAKATLLPHGPKMLRITDIQHGSVNWDTVPHCVIDSREMGKFRLAPGDLVFARTGATVGKSFLIDEVADAVFASYLIRLRFHEGVLPAYIALFFQSQDYWQQIADRSLGIAQPNVNANTLGGIRLRLPSRQEQARAVALVAEVDAALERAFAGLDVQMRRAHGIRSSTLAAAFSGDLVGQDPEDEPASALVERIMAERAGSDVRSVSVRRKLRTPRQKATA